MSRAAKTNVILFIIVITLSLIAWFQPGLHQTVYQYLSSLKAKDINTIIIERKDIGSIKLNKRDNVWFLQEPYQLPANPQRVDTVTALAEKRSYSRFQVMDEELSRYHLDDPLVAIWLNESKFVIGSNDPINQQRYAMNIDENIHSGHNTIHLINGVVFYQLRANLDSFLSPRLLPPLSAKKLTIKSIAWFGKKLTIEQGKWRLTPDEPGLSADSIAQFIQFWEQAQASRVETSVSLNIDNAELSKSKAITITLNDRESALAPIQFLIIQQDETIKLLRTDIQVAYWITPQILKLLTEFIPVQSTPSR